MNYPLRPEAVDHSDDGFASGDLCLANARLVMPDQVLTGSITIEKGVITDIAEGDERPSGCVDCAGDFVMPGLVELHTDNLERHMEPRPEVDWPHLPALIAHDAELASVGITTVFDALRAGSIHSGKGRYIDYARAVADELLAARAKGVFKISHFLHLRAEICSETLLEELARFTPDDRVGIVSLMDHTPGQRQFRDLTALRTYIAKKRGMDDNDFAEHVANLKRLQSKFGDKHEKGAVLEANRLGAVLASHDDTTRDHVIASQENGVGFAEFPTTREAAQACRDRGIAVMMGAPNVIRGGSHSGNVAAMELAEADLLDILSSDYVPGGLLLSAFRIADVWGDLSRAIATVTRTPALAAGLPDRGSLQTGLRGDVLRVSNTQGTPVLGGVWAKGGRIA
ncbi:alpha-D-ribose 1-methylphosphonate 5-triphosphate diphosphatase [Ascidiaceihabitans sp.]|uniref:alpha-D-ribose 1-methylphosphonate 5-triphosphate diphosphatase n=1 Tax=Ascidiaceihabitans sp. TaxID=1872644 RepID=UPI0032969EF8